MDATRCFQPGLSCVLIDWRWWTILVVLIVIGYVQDVGSYFDRASGIRRLKNLDFYRSVFGWFYPLFRWGGLVRILALVGSIFVFGWIATAILTGIVMLVPPMLLARIALLHTAYLLAYVGTQITSERELDQ
ncbi:MAG: hypothetical protein JO069_07870 [Verrucomicrobia bacterium]|nr:hypothetical protein [Verrucomicrobiota bacterium]